MEETNIVYTLKNCPNCLKAKQMMKKLGINFSTKRMDNPDVMTELNLEKIFPVSAPVIKYANQVFYTFEEFAGCVRNGAVAE